MLFYVYRLDHTKRNSTQQFIGSIDTEGNQFWKSIAEEALKQGVVTQPGEYAVLNPTHDPGRHTRPIFAFFKVELDEQPLKVVAG